jgi:DNA-binding transcriptional MocR family regulator
MNVCQARKTSSPPLIARYRTIADQISRMIAQGGFVPGDRLPSIRELGRRLEVGINTVAQAYVLLEHRGCVEARPQSGFFVRPRRPAAGAQAHIANATPQLIAHDVSFGSAKVRVVHRLADPRLLSLGGGAPSQDLLPVEQLNRMLATQARTFPVHSASVTGLTGLQPLRREIAKRSLGYAGGWSPDQIIVTAGCKEAITLALQATCRRGDTVAVESPVYYGFLNALEWMRLKVLEIPTIPAGGMNLDVLEFALQRHSVRACLVISNFNNPLGGLMPDPKKRQLVQLLARRGIPLIEDDVYGDLGYNDRRPPALKAFDETGNVLYCSSFSKTLAPGYRVGWIVPGRFQTKIEELKTILSVTTATPTQAAVAEFLAHGGYDRHLRAVRRVLRSRMERTRERILRCFPAGTRVSQPAGGYVLWVELPDELDGFRLHEAALKRGIGVAPGRLFTTGAQYGNCIRLNSSEWSDRVEKAVATLGELAGRLAQERHLQARHR